MKLFGRKKEDDISSHIQNLEIKQGVAPTPSFQSQSNQKTNFVNPFDEGNSQNSNYNTNNSSEDLSIPQTTNYYQSAPLNQNFGNMNNIQNSNSKDQNQAPQYTQNPNFDNEYNQLNNFSTPQGLSGSQKQLSNEQIQEMIDETIEKLLEEKWETIVDNVAKIAAWKEKQESEMKSLKEDLIIIRDNFEKLEKKLSSKISDYDKNVLDVNSEMKALEKVFQKITPTLVNNVNELSKITQELKSLKSQGDKDTVKS